MKYNGRELEEGESVRIFKHRGIFLSAEYIGDVFAFRKKSPMFKLDDGSCVYGYDSWWKPEKEARELPEGEGWR